MGVFGFMIFGHLKYWLRPGSSDLNTTLGLALIGMIAWAFICLRVSGAKLLWVFGNKASKEETPKLIYVLSPIFIGVGLIESYPSPFVDFLIVPSLRKCIWWKNLLTSMTALAPWAVPVPFFFMKY